MPGFAVVDHLGWHEQGDGLLYLGLPVASGRIADRPGESLRTALREIIGRFGCDPILLPSQDILLSNIAPQDRATIDAALRGHGVIAASDVTPVRRWSLDCPALPTCGLALTEAERIQTPLIDAIEERLARHALIDEKLTIRITACPNGSPRPYSA